MITDNTIHPLVYTVKNRCRVCYTCVRECQAKAIRIVNGQAEVIPERCIGCGTCTRVCSQGAKVYQRSIDEVYRLLKSQEKVIACVAPSFPAEFDEMDYDTFVGMIKALGFFKVTEVAFGADLVAQRYKEIFQNPEFEPCISADCPVIVNYIAKYQPSLVSSIAPVISPLMAMARVVRKKYGDDCKVVFIGPCVAKKVESADVDYSLTFTELREMFQLQNIQPESAEAHSFDPPLGGQGAILPIKRGTIQAADMEDGVLKHNILAAEGRMDTLDAIKEFKAGSIRCHLELLSCKGCIMGPGMSNGGKQFARTEKVSRYVRQKLKHLDYKEWKKNFDEFQCIDLSRSYQQADQRCPVPTDEEIAQVLNSMGKYSEKDHLNCGACGYDTCIDHAIAICRELAEQEMCLPYSIDKLHNSVNELAVSNKKLASMQQALKQSEKLASMGQLSAGIAHELNNPLGVVIMYANILLEENNGDEEISDDLKLIVEQANRCKKIVGGLLNFARSKQVRHDETNIEQLAKQSLSSLIIPDKVSVSLNCKCDNKFVMLDTEQITQVLNNLAKNAIEAMPDGGKLKIDIEDNEKQIFIHVSDTGTGIPKEKTDKIFEPFYTTKGIGKGTGLGLATTYGIIKMHKGKITVTSNDNPNKGKTGTTFKIVLPRRKD